MVFNRLKSDFVLVRFRDNTYGIVYQKRYSNILSRKLEKRARVLFRGNTRSCIKKNSGQMFRFKKVKCAICVYSTSVRKAIILKAKYKILTVSFSS